MLNKNTNTSTLKFTYIVNKDVAQLKIQIKAYQSLNIQIKTHHYKTLLVSTKLQLKGIDII